MGGRTEQRAIEMNPKTVSPIDLKQRLITSPISDEYIQLHPFIMAAPFVPCWLEYSGAPGIHDSYIADADPRQTLAEYLSLPGLSLWIDGTRYHTQIVKATDYQDGVIASIKTANGGYL